VTFSATDQGPGLAYVKLVVDGETVQSQTIDTNGGHCIPVPGHDAYTWAYQVPCKTSVGGRTYELNTAHVADGSHHVQVMIEDAAGNQSIVLDRTVATNNAPVNTTAPAITAPSVVATGAALNGGPGAWSAPAGAGSITYAYQWQHCDPSGNNCQAIPGAQSPSYTPVPSDAGHTLRLLVSATDNDGSTSVASSATSAGLSPQGSPGAGVEAAGRPAADMPNGTGASENAQLRLGVPHSIARSFARRAFKLTGRLLDSQGHPIAGATLDVLQQMVGSNSAVVIRRATTGPTGAFTVAILAGPSRLIEVAYRAFSADADYAMRAGVLESVGAGVELHVSPRGTSSTGTIVLSGRVQGPIPPQGTIVDLLVHYRGKWEPFRTPRTNSTGRFRVNYQFNGAVGRFPFRAEVPAGQASFPYSDGLSYVVAVTTS
jgi:hypothetical protein